MTSERTTTLSDALQMLASGETSSIALTEAALAAADAQDEDLGVFVSRFPDAARAAARAADEARAVGGDRSLLGIPLGIKDIIATADGPTTGQSLVHDPDWMQGDAEVVARLRSAGALVVGKTTTMEFALGAPDPTKPFPQPANPWDTRRWAGGSSSGSGSGVAAGMFFGAVGTDTGASVRMPSALCGITGLKPTFGRVPKSGVIPLGFSLDCVGPMARSARDCAVMLGVMAGVSAGDPYSRDVPVPDYVGLLDRDLTGLRIGVDTLVRFSRQTRDDSLEQLLADVVRTLEAAGATVVPVQLPLYREVTAAGVINIVGEAFAYHAPDVRERWSDYFASTRAGLAMSVFTSGGDQIQAQRVRRVGRRAVREVFADVDVILTPTVSRPAPPLEEAGAYTGTLFAASEYAYHTAYWNALGNPALTMPMGLNGDGLPMSAQLIGRPFDEATVLRVADAYQGATSFHLAQPVASTAPLTVTEPPQLPDLDVSFAESLLTMNGLTVPEEELAGMAAAQAMVRANVDLVYSVPEARYEVPGTNMEAELF